MARSLPTVQGDTLVYTHAGTTQSLVVGSAAWYAWLADVAAFAFASPAGTFTARKERASSQRGGYYWYAYRKGHGKLRKVYLGRAEELTLARLNQAATTLAEAASSEAARDIAPGTRPTAPAEAPRLPRRPRAVPTKTQPAHILTTKLYVPQVPAGLVLRPRLLARLDAGLSGPLTLVSAPAGFGKTTLLADWLQQTLRPAAWLALDAEDNDLHQFLRYLVAALQTIAPALGAMTLALLQAQQAPPLASLLTVLLNDLAALPQASILILDDYHAIDAPRIDQAVTFLLDHLPPQLHLVIATREDPPLPLARLRARRQLNELRVADLRFTTDEAAVFLNEVMGLPLSPAEVAALEQRTEGWIAGLQLAALSMQHQKDRAGFIAAFTGSHRYILDYLVEEVLARQPAHIQTFLLQTSILDRLCGPLCDAVVGGAEGQSGYPLAGEGAEETEAEADSSSPIQNRVPHPEGTRRSEIQNRNGQALLEELERANLFLVPLDDAGQWYRYHHLFAEVLRQRLIAQRAPGVPASARGEAVATLHRRAAGWYEEQGLLPEAIQHAFAAQDWVRAARLLEQNAELLLMRGEFLTLHRWLQALPRDVVRKQPHLLLAQAWAQNLAEPFLQSDAVEAILCDVEAMLGLGAGRPTGQEAEAPALDRERAELRGKLAAIRASMAGNQEDIPRTIALAHEALTYLPTDNLFWRIIPAVDRGLALAAAGEVGAASQAFTQAIELSRKAGNTYAAMIATMHLARVRAMEGQLHTAAELHECALAMAAQQGWGQLPMVGLPHVWLGKLLYEWNDLEAATRHLLQGIKLVEPREQQRVLLEGYATLARVKQAQGDGAGALAMMRQAEQVAQTTDAPWAQPLLGTYRARLWLAQGEIGRAGRWVEQAGLRVDGEIAVQREREYVTLARVLIAQDKPGEALLVMERLLPVAEAAGRLARVIEILALQAMAVQGSGDPVRALNVLHKALLLARAEGYIRTFIDEGAPMAALLARGLRDRDWSWEDEQQNRPVRTYATTLLAAFPRTEDRGLENEQQAPYASAFSHRAPSGQDTRSSARVEPLSPRELEVLRLVAAGKSNAEIARTLVIAVSTVKAHINTIFDKIDVTSRTQAIVRARDLDLL